MSQPAGDDTGTKLKLMGTFGVQSANAVVFPTQACSRLLAFLAYHRDQDHSRNDVARTFWPESTESAARANLRQTLHRIKQVAEAANLIVVGEETLRISRDVTTDLQEAQALHRQFSFAPYLPESLKFLAEEHAILQSDFLEGWNDPWIEDIRLDLRLRANALAETLASAYESHGRLKEALELMRKLAENSPSDVEIIERVVRLETQCNGPAAGTQFFDNHLASMNESALPKSLRRLLRKVRDSQFEQVQPPEFFESRNEMMLLARLVESNLKSGDTEAMLLLAKESSKLENWTHPSTLLSILTVALDNSKVQSDAEIEVAINATFLGSYASDYQVGIWAGERALAALDPTDVRAMRVLSVIGFLHFEAQDNTQARRCLEQAYEWSLHPNGKRERPRVMNRYAVLEYHLGNFDVAKELFLQAIALEIENNVANRDQLLASFHSNICTMEVLRGGWEEAVKHGELALKFAENNGRVYSIYVRAGLGLAKLKLGDRSGLELIKDGIQTTLNERMQRFNLMANDFGAHAVAELGSKDAAGQLAAANARARSASGYPRSEAEQHFMASIQGESRDEQTLGLPTVSRWIVEELSALSA